jgi:hypothetical protein
MPSRNTISYTVARIPTLSQYLAVVDSTLGVALLPTASTAATAVPGLYRGRWPRKRVVTVVRNGDQAITVRHLILSNSPGTTNAAWEVDTNAPGAGSVALAANTTTAYSWCPPSPDYKVELVAGGTAPATLVTSVTIDDDVSPGV